MSKRMEGGDIPRPEIAASILPRQAGSAAHNRNNLGASTPSMTDINVSHLSSMPPQRDVGTDNLGTLPRVKSTTWTLNNRRKTPTNRVAVISLKSLNSQVEDAFLEANRSLDSSNG